MVVVGGRVVVVVVLVVVGRVVVLVVLVVVLVVVVVVVLVVVVGNGSLDWRSNAPISHFVLPVPGRGRLRWSVLGGGQSAPPLSSAALPAKSACVNVEPPLLARGATPGLVLMMSPVPKQRLFVHVVPVGQSVATAQNISQLLPTSML